MLPSSLPPGSPGLRDAQCNLGALIPTWAGAEPPPQYFSPPSHCEGRLPAFQLRKSTWRALRSPLRTSPQRLPVAAWASKGASAEPHTQPRCHVPRVDAGAARSRPFGGSLGKPSPQSHPGQPGGLAMPPPACSKPSMTWGACERQRATLAFPHVPAPSWCPPLPGCPQSADPPGYISWKKNPFPFGSHLGRMDLPPRALPLPKQLWSLSSSHRGRGVGPPRSGSRILQPLTATKRPPRVWEDGGTVGRPRWAQPRDARGGEAGPAAPTGHTHLQTGANSSCVYLSPCY